MESVRSFPQERKSPKKSAKIINYLAFYWTIWINGDKIPNEKGILLNCDREVKREEEHWNIGWGEAYNSRER